MMPDKSCFDCCKGKWTLYGDPNQWDAPSGWECSYQKSRSDLVEKYMKENDEELDDGFAAICPEFDSEDSNV